MKKADIREAQLNLNQLIDVAVSGEEVIITKDGKLMVKLVPVLSEPKTDEKKAPRHAGSAKGRVWISDDFDEPLEDFKDYM